MIVTRRVARAGRRLRADFEELWTRGASRTPATSTWRPSTSAAARAAVVLPRAAGRSCRTRIAEADRPGAPARADRLAGAHRRADPRDARRGSRRAPRRRRRRRRRHAGRPGLPASGARTATRAGRARCSSASMAPAASRGKRSTPWAPGHRPRLHARQGHGRRRHRLPRLVQPLALGRGERRERARDRRRRAGRAARAFDRRSGRATRGYAGGAEALQRAAAQDRRRPRRGRRWTVHEVGVARARSRPRPRAGSRIQPRAPPQKAVPTSTTGKWRPCASASRIERLEQLVQRAEPARQDDEALGVADEHDLAREEVVEAQGDVQVGVRRLLEAAARCSARPTSRRPRGRRGWRPPSSPGPPPVMTAKPASPRRARDLARELVGRCVGRDPRRSEDRHRAPSPDRAAKPVRQLPGDEREALGRPSARSRRSGSRR